MKTLEKIHNFDTFILLKLFDSKAYAYLAKPCYFFSKTGDGWLYLLVALLSIIIAGFENLYFWSLLISYSIERGVYYVLKNTLKRNRPFNVINIKNLIVPSDQFSFPSGHTSAACVFTIITLYFLPFLAFLLLPWAIMVACSRVVLGVHYPTDILVGMLLGGVVAYFSLILVVIQ